ncbi:MAG: LysE family translocator [Bauldia sp.]|nr:LysE family translocator [Bauldia sp.]
MPIETYLAYAAAALAITVVPGPTVTLIIANSLTHGSAAGWKNILGTQLGLGVMIVLLAIGLSWIVGEMAVVFDWLRLAGAAYLIWLGIRLVRNPPGLEAGGTPAPPRGGFVPQGLLVILTNPKVLVVFGAFIPQFVDPNRGTIGQVLLLGATFMVIATITDGAYAVVFGKARGAISRARMRLVGRISGLFLIGGGAWLALTRAK